MSKSSEGRVIIGWRCHLLQIQEGTPRRGRMIKSSDPYARKNKARREIDGFGTRKYGLETFNRMLEQRQMIIFYRPVYGPDPAQLSLIGYDY